MRRQRSVKTAPPRGRPRDPATDVAIRRAALDLVREVGYEGLAMDAIAARAGVGKATLYRRWQSTEDVVADAVLWIVRQMDAPDTGTLRGDLRVLMRDTTRLYADPATPGLLAGFVGAMARSPRIATALRTGFIGMRREATAVVLRRAVRRGDLPRGTHIELAVDLLHAPLMYRAIVTGTDVNEATAMRVVDVVLNGLEARA